MLIIPLLQQLMPILLLCLPRLHHRHPRFLQLKIILLLRPRLPRLVRLLQLIPIILLLWPHSPRSCRCLPVWNLLLPTGSSSPRLQLLRCDGPRRQRRQGRGASRTSASTRFGRIAW